MYDLIVRNGKVVSPTATVAADVAVKDGVFALVGDVPADARATRVIEAAGKFLLPGVIEAHMHCYAPFQGCIDANNFYTQSVSAAFGGVTMFMDFANTWKGDSVYKKVVVREREMSESAIDYSVHGKIVEYDEGVAADIERIIEFGAPTFKMFMIYKKEGVMASDAALLDVFGRAAELGGLPMLHCESDPIAVLGDELSRRDGGYSWKNFARSKPVLCEVEAFGRAVAYARMRRSPLLIVHTTNGECLELARRSHADGLPLYIETCPHYLTLSDACYEDELGFMAVCSPPLRPESEQRTLWQGLADGAISFIGSDDCAYTVAEKSKYLDRDPSGRFIQDYTSVPGGIAGLEARLPLLLSEGVSKGRLTLNQVAAVTSANVAKVYGCYPRKGVIAPGADADLVMVDMEKEQTLSAASLHNNTDYCLWDGLSIKGWPVATVANGKVLVENGEFKGVRGAGRFIKRKIPAEVLAGFALENWP